MPLDRHLSGPSTPTGLIGYSGGALASEWANELQPRYAPELKFAGVAAGGVPADLDYIARRIDGGPFAGIYVGAAVGLARAYPGIDTDTLLNARGKQAFAEVGGQCIEHSRSDRRSGACGTTRPCRSCSTCPR
ncbi:lipase family protein [Amycolatopsis sp. NPDC051372]|uniref:lipase family protein n=1 Tax=Amycolatopsis sp. NPDC051372 TaxID=3155669 RepID=UPI003437A414